MKTILSTALFLFVFGTVNAQTITVPNSGADNTVPPSNINPLPGTTATPANPSNSTIPGANGSYSVSPGNPDMTNPPVRNSYSVGPGGTPGRPTGSPQAVPKRK